MNQLVAAHAAEAPAARKLGRRRQRAPRPNAAAEPAAAQTPRRPGCAVLHDGGSRGDARDDPEARPARHRRARPARVPPDPAARGGRHRLADLPPGAGRLPRPDRPPLERSRQALRRRARGGAGARPTASPGSTPSRASSTPSRTTATSSPTSSSTRSTAATRSSSTTPGCRGSGSAGPTRRSRATRRR